MCEVVDLGDTLKGIVLKTILPSKQCVRGYVLNTGVVLVKYFERRAHEEDIDASRLFLYKITRKMLNFKGD